MQKKELMRTLGWLAVVPALIAGMALAVTLAPVSPSSTAHAGQDVCPPNPSPPDADDPDIIVEAPAANATVTSPVTISGQARTFEANVRLRILAEDGTALADTFTTATAGAPEMGTFSEAVAFVVATTQAGCIQVFEDSAVDGSEINMVQVPVTLQAPEEPTPPPVEDTPTPPAVVPPPTGTGDAAGSGTSAWTFAAIAALLMLAAAVPTLALARRRA